MRQLAPTARPALDRAKFRDPDTTAKGEPRAKVALTALRTLWFNTGTLCNIACHNCYIESGPRNDRLGYLTLAEVAGFLDELVGRGGGTTVGFTGGEPFMNPDLPGMLEAALGRGFDCLVLTNAMRPMQRRKAALAPFAGRDGGRLTLRVSLDHYSPDLHELLRGQRTWAPAIAGLRWLAANGFRIAVAGRLAWRESEPQLRAGYGRLFASLGLALDAGDPAELALFPEMDASLDVPEITEACWGLLNKSPAEMMCASSRMVVRHRGEARPSVMPCTLLPYDRAFDLGGSLAEADRPVALNHPHCARFCVLGGASCGG